MQETTVRYLKPVAVHIPGISPAISTIKAKRASTRWRREERQEVGGGAGGGTTDALR